MSLDSGGSSSIHPVSLTEILLYNGNKHPPISLAHAVNMKETYVNIQGLLKNEICYEHHHSFIHLFYIPLIFTDVELVIYI
jgi:hypothetical protein